MEEPEPRQAAILTAAFEAFRQYGFRRSSMEDIARAAGMSRAALYLHYRNKEDIFRSLVQHYFDWAVAAVEHALAGEGPPEPALTAAFQAQGGTVVEALMSSPHGAEFIDTKSTFSAEVVAAGEAALVAVYADWLRRQVAAGTVTLEALANGAPAGGPGGEDAPGGRGGDAGAEGADTGAPSGADGASPASANVFPEAAADRPSGLPPSPAAPPAAGDAAQAVAAVMLGALNGLKAGRQAGGPEAYAAYRADVDRLARLFGRALAPR